jgi:hypothetical protein
VSYRDALEKAGATVLAFDEFGDYQGTWLAKVTVGEEIRLITGSYGSCSGCDSFQAEFDFRGHDCLGREYEYPSDEAAAKGCEECLKYQREVADFGRRYLDDPVDPAVVRKRFEEDRSWDSDAEPVLKWLDQHFPPAVN